MTNANTPESRANEEALERASVDAWNAAIDAAAVAAEAFHKEGREWLRDSVWAKIKRETAKDIRALKRPEQEGDG